MYLSILMHGNFKLKIHIFNLPEHFSCVSANPTEIDMLVAHICDVHRHDVKTCCMLVRSEQF